MRPRPASAALAFLVSAARPRPVHTFDGETSAFGEAFHAASELFVVEAFDFIEEGYEEDWCELAKHNADDEEDGGGDEPPIGAGVPDHPEQAGEHGAAEDDAERGAFEPIGDPAAERLIAEHELMLDDEAGIERQRQRDRDVDGCHDGE